jgi:hypothetical protein
MMNLVRLRARLYAKAICEAELPLCQNCGGMEHHAGGMEHHAGRS